MVETGSAVPDEMGIAATYADPVSRAVAYNVDQLAKGKEPNWEGTWKSMFPTPSNAQVQLRNNQTQLNKSYLSQMIGIAMIPFGLAAGARFLERRGLLGGGTK